MSVTAACSLSLLDYTNEGGNLLACNEKRHFSSNFLLNQVGFEIEKDLAILCMLSDHLIPMCGKIYK